MQIMFPKCNDNDNKNIIYSNTYEYIVKYRRLVLIQFLRVGRPAHCRYAAPVLMIPRRSASELKRFLKWLKFNVTCAMTTRFCKAGEYENTSWGF